MQSANPRILAEAAFDKHAQLRPKLEGYPGTVSLHALARLAVVTGDPRLLDKAKSNLAPFLAGERQFRCNFPNYRCGGNGTAFLLWQGHLPEAAETVRHYADQILNDAPRDPNGILCRPANPEEGRIWIDAAFAVTPFLLFAGMALNEAAYIEEAFQQTAKMLAAFLNEDNGLYHQGRNFNGPESLSEDHWSRGNGWGAYALTELAAYLPDNHPHQKAAVKLFQDHVAACANFQNDQGLWHQEMTEPKSYVETSGSALLLYQLGVGLKTGLIAESERPRFERGLAGLLPYITGETDIHHTCTSCLCPGDGSIIHYMAKPPIMNDQHAFGPVALAFGQAHALGIKEVTRKG